MKEFGRGISEAFGDFRVGRHEVGMECVVYKKNYRSGMYDNKIRFILWFPWNFYTEKLIIKNLYQS